jgi:hypothetical protein
MFVTGRLFERPGVYPSGTHFRCCTLIEGSYKPSLKYLAGDKHASLVDWSVYDDIKSYNNVGPKSPSR